MRFLEETTLALQESHTAVSVILDCVGDCQYRGRQEMDCQSCLLGLISILRRPMVMNPRPQRSSRSIRSFFSNRLRDDRW